MSQVLDPTTGENTQVLSQLYSYVTAMVFVMLNAHQWLFAAIYKSFQAFPLSTEWIFTGGLTSPILHMSASMFSIGISMTLPIFCVMFVSEVLMGFMSKMMPQMNIFMVSLPLKIYLGLLLSLIFMRPMAEYMGVIIEQFLTKIASIF